MTDLPPTSDTSAADGRARVHPFLIAVVVGVELAVGVIALGVCLVILNNQGLI